MLHLTTVDTATYSLLKKIFETAIIKNNFALAGGTSLALQIGHRRSVDLDLFCTQPFKAMRTKMVGDFVDFDKELCLSI